MLSDWELLAAWRDGDATAGGQLYERYFDGLCWFFRNKVADGVEDLVQATFMVCIESRDGFSERGSFRALLFSIARRKLVDQIRKGYRGQNKAEIGTMTVDSLAGSPSAVLTKRQEQQMLVHALRRIPLDSQILLELFYWEQLTGPELALALGIAEGTVRTRLRRSRALLTEALRSIEQSGERLESTLTNLDAWARSIRTDKAVEG